MRLSVLSIVLLCFSAHALQLPGPQTTPPGVVDGAVTTAKISDGAVTSAKVDSTVEKSPVNATVSGMPWVRWFKGDAITPVADATAISSWIDSSSNAGPAVQATGGLQPIYKIAANGINGVPAVRFSGGQFLRTAVGGTSMATNFYMGVVFKFSSISTVHIVCFGDDGGAGHRRGMLMRSGTSNVVEFNSQGADSAPPTPATISTGEPHFYEIEWDGLFLYHYLDGKLLTVGQPSGFTALIDVTSDPITLGANNGGGENVSGDMCEALFLGSVPTRAQQIAIDTYITTKYGLTYATPIPVLASSATAVGTGLQGQAGNADKGFEITGALKLGGAQRMVESPLSNQGTNTKTLEHAFYGAVGMDATGSGTDHLMATDSTTTNVVTVWNKANGGYSAIRFCNDVVTGGFENFAIGVANASAGAVFQATAGVPCAFLEPSWHGELVVTQLNSDLNGGNDTQRIVLKKNGDILIRDGSAAVGPVTIKVAANGVITFTGMTTTVIDALTAVEGMFVYDATLHKLKFYNGTVWKTVTTD